jgi:hypothetical protein
MSQHVLAFVKWTYFKETPEQRQRMPWDYWYVSRNPHIRSLLEDGGTLWTVTSRKIGSERIYSLAYKLANCTRYKEENIPRYVKNKFGKYGIIGDAETSVVFGRWYDITDELLRLTFSPEKPISRRQLVGQSLQNARRLAERDVRIMERLADTILYGKNFFVSYSSKDRSYAEILQKVLLSKNYSVFMDVRTIPPGDDWKEAINNGVKTCEALLLLVSNNSAASSWVKQEVENALKLKKKILPIVLSSEAWKKFEEIHHLQRRDYRESSIEGFSEFCFELIEELRSHSRMQNY